MPVISVPANIYSDFAGYYWLCSLARSLSDASGSVRLDFAKNHFFDGNLCAVLGALLHRYQLNIEAVVLDQSDIQPAVLRALSMNDFAPTYGGPVMNDEFDTAVKFRRFELEQSKDFARYLGIELLNKEIPLMESTKRDFRTALVEVFNNARTHSESPSGLFSCGQHFPTREIINYTMVDLGIGFGASVSRRFGRAIESKTAISWAVVAGHSSRQGAEFGGMGLSEIQSIIAYNEGAFHILSGDALWEFRPPRAKVLKMRHPFDGTIVNLQVNVALDKHRQMEAEWATAKSSQRENLV